MERGKYPRFRHRGHPPPTEHPPPPMHQRNLIMQQQQLHHRQQQQQMRRGLPPLQPPRPGQRLPHPPPPPPPRPRVVNYRQEEKRILDRILNSTIYDTRMRPRGVNSTGKEKKRKVTQPLDKKLCFCTCD